MFTNKNIFVVLTYKCNAFCKKCMTRYHENKDTEISEEAKKRIIYLLTKYNYSGLISIGTGEPLLYNGLTDFVTNVLSINDSIRFRILTNGMALVENGNSKLFNKRCTFGISMDAFYQETLQDLQKGMNIEKVKNNISEISKKYGPDKLYLNFIVYQNNVDEILPFCRFAMENGISEIYFTELKIFKGYEDDLKAHSLKCDYKLSSIIEEASAYLRMNNISSNIDHFLEKSNKYECYKRNTASPIIDVNGNVSFCSGREDIYVGNILDDDINEKWQSFKSKVGTKWCEGCYDIMQIDGTYLLPRTIKR